MCEDAGLFFYMFAVLEDFSESSMEPPLPLERLVVVPRGGQVEILCVVPKGLPKPRSWWEDPGEHTIGDTGRLRVADMRLLLDSARKGDAGNYTCVAQNLAATHRTQVQVFVAGEFGLCCAKYSVTSL